jgi:hypothetical protein
MRADQGAGRVHLQQTGLPQQSQRERVQRGDRDLGELRQAVMDAIYDRSRTPRLMAEAFVNDTTAIVPAWTPEASSQRTRSSIVADLPVPGPATNRTQFSEP